MRILLSIALVMGFYSCTIPVFASAKKGLAVAKKVDEQDDGYVTQVGKLKMTLRNRSGQESERQLEVRMLEKDGGDKSVTFFHSPRDVKGTALLNHSKLNDADMQWLYMPSLKRVKRISGRSKSGSFIGSEFSYEDLSSQNYEEYTYNYLKEGKLKGRGMHIFERFPKDKDSGYKKQIVWADKKHYRIFKVEYYDRKGELLKTMSNSGYKQHEGKHWRPKMVSMINHQTGKSTTLFWNNYVFGKKLSESDFRKTALKRLK